MELQHFTQKSEMDSIILKPGACYHEAGFMLSELTSGLTLSFHSYKGGSLLTEHKSSDGAQSADHERVHRATPDTPETRTDPYHTSATAHNSVSAHNSQPVSSHCSDDL